MSHPSFSKTMRRDLLGFMAVVAAVILLLAALTIFQPRLNAMFVQLDNVCYVGGVYLACGHGVDETATNESYSFVFYPQDGPRPPLHTTLTVDYRYGEHGLTVNCWDEGKVVWNVVGLSYHTPTTGGSG